MMFIAAFPVLAFVNIEEPLRTAIMASKLLLLPLGAVCLLGAIVMNAHHKAH